MESNNDPKWLEERLTSLKAEGEWQPDSARGWTRLQERRQAASARGRRWAWTLSAAAAGFACLMTYPVTRAFAARCVSACVEESSRFSGLLASLSVRTSTNTPLENHRKPAPDFTLRDASGKSVKLSDFRGQVVLLNFWATWCAPCNVEIPWFAEFQRTYGPRNFAVLGVSFDDDGWQSVAPYIEAKKMNYPVVLGNDDVGNLYGSAGVLPATFLIDKSGRIAVTHVGLCPKSDYESEINSLLKEK